MEEFGLTDKQKKTREKFLKKYNILKTLECERIVAFDVENFYVEEMCDEYFGVELSTEDIKQLRDFFSELYILSINRKR